jgi:hypothetical protein
LYVMAGWLRVIAVALWRAIVVAVLVMAQMRRLSVTRFRATLGVGGTAGPPACHGVITALGGLSLCGEVVGVVARAVCAP